MAVAGVVFAVVGFVVLVIVATGRFPAFYSAMIPPPPPAPATS